MLTRLDLLNFGSFKDFAWSNVRDGGNNVAQFGKLNVIYGRNYSGKTTLSRAARCLEVGGLPPKFDPASAFVAGTSSGDVNQAQTPCTSHHVRVYNRDFVDGHLGFLRDDAGHVQPFAVVGAKNTEVSREIGKREERLFSLMDGSGLRKDLETSRIAAIAAARDHREAERFRDNHFDKKANGKPNGIKWNSRYKKHTYTVANLRADIATVERDNIVPLTDTEREALEKFVDEQVLPTANVLRTFSPRLGALAAAANAIVTRNVAPSQPIQELLRDTVLQAWVKEGIQHHKDRTTCAFCRQSLPANFWAEIGAHFNRESERLSADIAATIASIAAEVAAVQGIGTIAKASVYSFLQPELEAAHTALAVTVADYVAAQKAQLDSCDGTVQEIERLIRGVKEELETLRNQLHDERRGAEKVNDYLNKFFGHEGLRLVAESDTGAAFKFLIKRGDVDAFNLSEGECSLVAFCYFMAKLEDVDTSGKKLIVWIDDPISSLDANHIFFVYSLIEAKLARPMLTAPATAICEQLFVSTHNLEFLRYLRALSGTKGTRYFHVTKRRTGSWVALLPKYMETYVTEFNYLFGEICVCADAANEARSHHSFYNFGNNLRKFLEAFLFFKYPSTDGTSTLESRTQLFFPSQTGSDVLVNRLMNSLSHLQGDFERAMEPMDRDEMARVARYVLERIRTADPQQYAHLVRSTGKPCPLGTGA